MAWTLADIRAKVRNVTGSPSTDQITDAALNVYINNYYQLTMPFELKEQIQLKALKFKTTPAINVYSFPGAFLTDQPAAYADGYPLIFYQDPDVFYQDWPQQYAVDVVGTGDGSTASFSGGLQNPPIIIGTTFITDGFQVVQDEGNSTASQTIAFGSGIVAYSGTLAAVPIVPGSLSITDGVETFIDNGSGLLTGSLGGSGTIVYTTGAWAVTFNTAVVTGRAIIGTYTFVVIPGTALLTGNGIGTVNYITGAFNVVFTEPPAASATIYAKYQGYQPDRPQGVLFFNNQFTFMPVPDQVYQIQMQGYVTVDALVNDGDTPTLPEWGPLIAYGAALDIFSDRDDLEKYGQYYEILKRYENVALARTVQQFQAEQSVPRF